MDKNKILVLALNKSINNTLKEITDIVLQEVLPVDEFNRFLNLKSDLILLADRINLQMQNDVIVDSWFERDTNAR